MTFNVEKEFKIMRKTMKVFCQQCKVEMKNNPRGYDDYYFCSPDCIDEYQREEFE